VYIGRQYYRKRGGTLRGLRINREILILRKPKRYNIVLIRVTESVTSSQLLNGSVKGTNSHTWECISTVTWVYTNTLTRELNRYRPDQTRPDQTTTHFKSFLSIDKPIGASPGRDDEDGISTKNLVLNILWCRIVGNYRKRGGTLRGRATD